MIRYHTIHDRESYDDRKCDNDQESYRVPRKKWPQKKGFWPFSLAGWFYMDQTVLYDQGISLRRSGYPTCLYPEKKIDPRPSGAQKRAKKGPFGALDGKIRM